MHAPLKLSSPRCLRLRHAGIIRFAAALQARHLADKRSSDIDIEIPPEPTTCCMSGCANCVWIEYAQTLSKILGDNDERAREIVLAKITDPNLRAFLSMELQNLKFKQQQNTSKPEEEQTKKT